MARKGAHRGGSTAGKKAGKELTVKEKLEQALVPEDEQPYAVPGNWCWTYLRNIAEIIMGQSPAGIETTDDDSYMPLIGGAADMGDLYPKATRYTKVPTKISCNDDIILCIRATLGHPIFSNGEYCLGRGVAAIRPYQGKREFYRYFFLNFEQYLYDNATGTTFAQVSGAVLQEMLVPLPPIAEQKRIVDRIESLFAKLDEAKEKAQAVVDGFELRKSAILHKAFSGELTEQWRKEHGVGLDSWRQKRLNEVTQPKAGYAFDSEKFTDSGYQIIRMGNLYGGKLDLSRNPVFISENDVDKTVLERTLVRSGDILITLTGTKYKRDYGYAVCITNPENLLVNQRILCLTPSVTIERNYILYYLRSNIFRDIFFSNETGGVNQGNVSSKFVENIEIALPPFAEQHEIVTILDRLFEKEQRVKESAGVVLKRIDIMKKSILARAFRGELGTNDPKEESAAELLKIVLGG